MDKRILPNLIVMIAVIMLTGCSSTSSISTSGMPSSARTTSAADYNTPLWQGNAADIWEKLQRISPSRLASLENQTTDPDKRAWLQLALISKQKNINTQQLANALMAWREHNPNHQGNQLIPDNHTLNQLESQPQPKQIAILLPQSGTYAASGRAVREGFLNSYYAGLSKAGKQNVKFYDTAQTQNMTGLYQQAFNDGADFIVGPILKDNVQQLSSGSFTIPVLALNYTDVNWSLPSHFYEYGLLPEDEAAQIADRAHEAGHSRAIIIAPKNAWGNRMVAAFTPRWQADGGSVQDSWYYTPGGNYNKEVAQLMKVNPVDGRQPGTQQRRQDFDVIFLFSQPQDSHAIVPMLRYYYVGNVPIYATSAVYSGKPNPTRDVDLNGVIICDIPWSMRVAQSASGDSVQSDRLYAVGQDAYMLSQSMQRFSQLPNFPIYGKTGALVMSSTHQIHRRLPCVPVRNGLI